MCPLYQPKQAGLTTIYLCSLQGTAAFISAHMERYQNTERKIGKPKPEFRPNITTYAIIPRYRCCTYCSLDCYGNPTTQQPSAAANVLPLNQQLAPSSPPTSPVLCCFRDTENGVGLSISPKSKKTKKQSICTINIMRNPC